MASCRIKFGIGIGAGTAEGVGELYNSRIGGSVGCACGGGMLSTRR